MEEQKTQLNYWYLVMSSFVLLGAFCLWRGDYTWAGVNIAMGVALGGSGTQRWEDIPLWIKTTVCLLTMVSLSLFAYGTFHN